MSALSTTSDFFANKKKKKKKFKSLNATKLRTSDVVKEVHVDDVEVPDDVNKEVVDSGVGDWVETTNSGSANIAANTNIAAAEGISDISDLNEEQKQNAEESLEDKVKKENLRKVLLDVRVKNKEAEAGVADKDKADKGDVEKKVDDKAAAVGKWRPSRSSSSSAAYGSSSYGSSASPYSRSSGLGTYGERFNKSRAFNGEGEYFPQLGETKKVEVKGAWGDLGDRNGDSAGGEDEPEKAEEVGEVGEVKGGVDKLTLGEGEGAGGDEGGGEEKKKKKKKKKDLSKFVG